MLRKNYMNILMGMTLVGLLVTGYNVFIADDASSRVADYLNLDVAKEEVADTSSPVTTTTPTETTETPSTESTAPAEEPTTVAPAETEAVAETPTVTATTPAGDKAETVYTVKEGDTYGCVAEKYYGSYEHWVDVMNVNPNQVGFTEYGLHVGAQIVLPAIQAVNLKPASALCS